MGLPLKILLVLVFFAIPLRGVSTYNVRDMSLGRIDVVAVGVFTVVLLVYELCKSGIRRNTVNGGLTIFISVLVVVACVHGLWYDVVLTSYFTTWLQVSLGGLAAIAVANLPIRSDQDIRFILKIWLLAATIVAGVAVYQVVARQLGLPGQYIEVSAVPFQDRTPWGHRYGDYIRPSSFFAEPTRLANYLAAPALVLTTFVTGGESRTNPFRIGTGLLCAAIIWLAILLTASFGGYIAVLGGFLIAVVWRQNRFPDLRMSLIKKRLVAYLSGTILVSLVILGIAVYAGPLGVDIQDAWQRFTSITSDPSVLMRIGRSLISLELWSEHPLWGIGFNQAIYATKSVNFPIWMPDPVAFYGAADLWLSIGLQAGLVGICALCAVFASFYHEMKRASISYKYTILARVVMLIVAVNIFRVSLNAIHYTIWVELGVAAAILFLLRKKEEARLTRAEDELGGL